MKPSMLRNFVTLTLIIAFNFFTAYTVKGQMRQIYVDNIQTNNDIGKLSFYSPSEGFVAFSYWVGYTSDSGRTYLKKYITNNNVNYNGNSVNILFGFAIAGVKAFNQNELLVYGNYGLVPSILRSTDGGNSFLLTFHSQYNSLALSTGITDLVFPENNTVGFAVDADRILKTTNGGLNWFVIRDDPGRYFTNLEAIDNNNVLAFSTKFETNTLLKTSNGLSFQIVNLPQLTTGKMSYAYFLTASTGWISMYDNNNRYLFYKTVNSGTTWSLQNDAIATPFSSRKIKFTDTNVGYALSGLYTTYKTFNSGVTWEPLPKDNNYEYLGFQHTDIQVGSTNQIWAGGGQGFLELSTNGGGTPLPKAYFKIDTTGLWSTGNVALLNYSRNIYTYTWLVNGTTLTSAYNSSYSHDVNSTSDTISLIVSNGTVSDTTTRIQFFYPPVKVFSFSPEIAGAGNEVSITGLNFGGTLAVTFGGVAATSFMVMSSTSIKAVVGLGASGFVKVTTPIGRDSLAGFSFLPKPTITSFAPTSAIAGSTITLTGTNFTGATKVSFAGIDAISYTVVSSTTITALVPSGQSGTVTVITPGGSASLSGYIALPKILSFTPLQGTEGTIITISGTSLSGTTAVSVGGVNVKSFAVGASTSITAVVAAGASGDVLVTKTGGSAVMPGFTWINRPVITSFSPTSGPVGSMVTITGSGFSATPSNNIVYFGSVRAIVTATSATSISVEVPVGSSFDAIAITCNNLTAFSRIPFLVTFPNGGAITTGSFAARTVVNLPSDVSPMNIDAGDLDGDGKTDLVITASAATVPNTGLYIYRNTSSTSSVTFAPPLFISNRGYTEAAIGDLDGDGKFEIATVAEDSIATFLNTSTPGNLSFLAGGSFFVGAASGINIGDLDGDGKPDIVAADWRTHILRNVSNPGKIAFAPKVTLTGGGTRNIMIADLNGDEKPELISPDGSIYIFRNNCTKGNIAFSSSQIPGYRYSYLAVGDLDGDGKTDLVCSDPLGSKVGIIRNTSSLDNLSFDVAIELPCTEFPSGIAVSDLDGDGKPDIAAGTNNFSSSAFKNTSSPGNISFSAKISYVSGVFSYLNMLSINDVDGDGKNDLVHISQSQRIISIHRNTVTPSPFISSFSPSVGEEGSSVEISGSNFVGATGVSFGGVEALSFTVNSASSITAIVGSGATGNIAIQNIEGIGTKSGFVYGFPPKITSISPAFAPVGGTVTISGNYFSPAAQENLVFFGGVKAVITSSSSTAITALVPAGAAHEPVKVTVRNLTAYSPENFSLTFPGGDSLFTTGNFASGIERVNRGKGTLSDIDGDGMVDLVMAYSMNQMAIARNTSIPGAISFAANLVFPALGDARGAVTGDLDGDGRPDVVIFNYGSSNISVSRNLSSNGNIAMGQPASYSTGPSTTRSSDAVVHDVDGDGKPEIIVANYYSSTISIFKNLSVPGSIILNSRIDYTTPWGYPTGVAVRDMNGDGRPDLLASVNGESNITTFLNTSVLGTLSFALPTIFPAGNWPNGVALSDLDADAKIDLVVPNLNGSSFSIFKNLSAGGTISLAYPQDRTTYPGPRTTTVMDMDGDGRPDVIIGNTYSSAGFAIFKNISTTGNIALQPMVHYNSAGVSFKLSAGDIDGDGVPDISVFKEDRIAFFRNLIKGPSFISVCASDNASVISNISGLNYQWQEETAGGFVNLQNNAMFDGVYTQSLNISNVASHYRKRYRCNVGGLFSDIYALKIVNSWTGAVNNSWENPGNWSCGLLPDANTEVEISAGTVVLQSNTSVASLLILSGATLQVAPGKILTITR